jgi:hypothetical protein
MTLVSLSIESSPLRREIGLEISTESPYSDLRFSESLAVAIWDSDDPTEYIGTRDSLGDLRISLLEYLPDSLTSSDEEFSDFWSIGIYFCH